MSRQASCTSRAMRSLASSLLPLIGAKSITGSSLALAQRPSFGPGIGGATGAVTAVWTSDMVGSFPLAGERVDQVLARLGGVLSVPRNAARQHLGVVLRRA